jgi:hypothetical protein
MMKLDMKKFGENKVVQEKPWIVCLLWNIVVLAATLGMVVHDGNYFWLLMLWLISWPEDS